MAVTAIGVRPGLARLQLDDHGKAFSIIRSSSSSSSRKLNRTSRISVLCTESLGASSSLSSFKMSLARTSSFVPAVAASSTSEATTRVAEHVVFFALQQGTSEETKRGFVELLSKMGSLDGVIQMLTAESLKPSGEFSIGVYTRFSDKSFIGPYLNSPLHQDVMKDFVSPHVSSLVLLDYEINLQPPVDIDLFAIRIAALKFKPDASAGDKANVSSALRSLESVFAGKVVQVTSGQNFNDPKYAQGYDTAAVIRFKGPEQLKAVTGDPKFKDLMNTKLEPFLSSSIYLDLLK